MHKSILFAVVSSLMLPCAAAASGSTLKEVKDAKYKPGQVWSYHTRVENEGSTLTILRIDETAEKKRVVHVSVDHIHIKNCSGGPEPDKVIHMPFATEALDNSVTKLLRTEEVPDYKEGYERWRRAWDAGKAEFSTTTVMEAVEAIQQTFLHGLGCSK